MLVHGLGSSRATWNLILERLPRDQPVLRYDLRGCGQSTSDNKTQYSHAEDLRAMLDARGIRKAVICGVSMGGAITSNFALDNPDRVERIVLMNPALTGWNWTQQWRDIYRVILHMARRGQMNKARRFWYAHPMFAAIREHENAHILRDEIQHYSRRQWLTDRQRPAPPDLDRLPQLNCPVLLMTGDRDFKDFRLIAELIESSIPEVTRIDYKGAGHVLPLERPAEIADQISRFVSPEE